METKYKVGDKVIVTNIKYGHDFEIGEEIELVRENQYINWTCQGLGGSTWNLMEDEFKLK